LFLKELFDLVKGYLSQRAHAYRRVFDSENVYTEEVLKDLAAFCRGNLSTFNPDPRIHAVLEGRREVWLRIKNHLELTDAQLYKIYARKENE
jgi:hypothetical protein